MPSAGLSYTDDYPSDRDRYIHSDAHTHNDCHCDCDRNTHPNDHSDACASRPPRPDPVH